MTRHALRHVAAFAAVLAALSGQAHATIKPGANAAGEAPHIQVIVAMRGMLLHAFTRIYFADEAEANARDAALQSVPAERRDTLLARRNEEGGRVVYRFDIHMQGPRETVFFDV